jgi:hypothetical protein
LRDAIYDVEIWRYGDMKNFNDSYMIDTFDIGWRSYSEVFLPTLFLIDLKLSIHSFTLNAGTTIRLVTSSVMASALLCLSLKHEVMERIQRSPGLTY